MSIIRVNLFLKGKYISKKTEYSVKKHNYVNQLRKRVYQEQTQLNNFDRVIKIFA